MKHTNGKWKYVDCTPRDTDGRYTGLRYEVYSTLPDGSEYYICTTEGAKQALANARLIAAAPELLAALKRAVNLLECAEVSFLHQSSPAIVPREFYELIADLENNTSKENGK